MFHLAGCYLGKTSIDLGRTAHASFKLLHQAGEFYHNDCTTPVFTGNSGSIKFEFHAFFWFLWWQRDINSEKTHKIFIIRNTHNVVHISATLVSHREDI